MDSQQTNSESNRQGQANLLARLQRLSATDKATIVDDEFLTCGEYQLFVDEMRSANKNKHPENWFDLPLAPQEQEAQYYRQPDHWTAYNYPEGTGDKPICGVRGMDALDFCAWLNRKQKTKPLYRLPTPAEAEAHPARLISPNLATWCFDKGATSLIALDEASITSLKQQLLTLISSSRYPKLSDKFFQTDPDNLIRHSFDFDNHLGIWDHQRIDFPLLRQSLSSILGLSYGHPGRDLVVATNYDVAHAQQLAFLIKIARFRNLEGNTDWSYFLKHKLRLAGFNAVESAIQSKDWLKASNLISELAASSEVILKRWAIILGDYLAVARAETFLEIRRAVREHLGHLAWFAYLGYADKFSPALNRPTSRNYAKRQKYLQETLSRHVWRLDKLFTALFWQSRILVERENGRLNAWEGIRLVADYT